jgi:hypothetical protein
MILPQSLQNLRRIWHFISLFAVVSLNLQEILNNYDKQNIPSIYLAARHYQQVKTTTYL